MKSFESNGKTVYVLESLISIFSMPVDVAARCHQDISKCLDTINHFLVKTGESGLEILWIDDQYKAAEECVHIIRGKFRSQSGVRYDVLQVSDISKVRAKVEDNPLSALLESLGIEKGKSPRLDSLIDVFGKMHADKTAAEDTKQSDEKIDPETPPRNIEELLKKLFQGKGNIQVVELGGCNEDDCEHCNPTTTH